MLISIPDADDKTFMKKVYDVTVDGTLCSVTVSDENEALQAAYAAGGAILGIWREEAAAERLPEVSGAGARVQDTSGFDACLYLVTSEADVTPDLLERTARRRLDRPWRIAGTEHLLIREFASEDPLEPESEYDGDGVFSNWEKREAYRRSQYRFAECGLWALVEKETGEIVGKAGITDGELGYHIYPEYRGRGYAKEACRAILQYAAEELELTEMFLKVERHNQASLYLARKLGFSERVQTKRNTGDKTEEAEREENSQESIELYCFLYV